MVVANDCLELDKGRDLAHLTELGCRCRRLLLGLSPSCTSGLSLAGLVLLHHLGNLRIVLSHTGHHLLHARGHLACTRLLLLLLPTKLSHLQGNLLCFIVEELV